MLELTTAGVIGNELFHNSPITFFVFSSRERQQSFKFHFIFNAIIVFSRKVIDMLFFYCRSRLSEHSGLHL